MFFRNTFRDFCRQLRFNPFRCKRFVQKFLQKPGTKRTAMSLSIRHIQLNSNTIYVRIFLTTTPPGQNLLFSCPCQWPFSLCITKDAQTSQANFLYEKFLEETGKEPSAWFWLCWIPTSLQMWLYEPYNWTKDVVCFGNLKQPWITPWAMTMWAMLTKVYDNSWKLSSYARFHAFSEVECVGEAIANVFLWTCLNSWRNLPRNSHIKIEEINGQMSEVWGKF